MIEIIEDKIEKKLKDDVEKNKKILDCFAESVKEAEELLTEYKIIKAKAAARDGGA